MAKTNLEEIAKELKGKVPAMFQAKDLAKELRVTPKKARRLIRKMRKQGLVEQAGKLGRIKLWKFTITEKPAKK